MPLPESLQRISEKLASIGKSVFIVGGWTRADILGIPYGWDIDLATDATPDEMREVLQVIKEVGQKYGTLIVSEWGDVYEMTTFRRDIGSLHHRRPAEVQFTTDLTEDSQRRDFTMNAIYFDVKDQQIIDPQNGKQDIQNSIIRFVGNPAERIDEDALRILRYIRFKYTYAFRDADENIANLLQKNIGLLREISIERVREEFQKILLLEKAVDALKELKDIGFLAIFLPEVDALSGVPGGPRYHLEGDVWAHTLMTITEMKKLFQTGLTINGETRYYSQTEQIDLLWAMLLHDIGKASTFSRDADGNVHYYDHEHVGAEMARIVTNRFKMSSDSIRKIDYIIWNHLRIFQTLRMKKMKARKFMMHRLFSDLLTLGIADHLGRIPADPELVSQMRAFYGDFLRLLKTKRFLTGNDVMERYPDLEGRVIGEKLQELNDRILGE